MRSLSNSRGNIVLFCGHSSSPALRLVCFGGNCSLFSDTLRLWEVASCLHLHPLSAFNQELLSPDLWIPQLCKIDEALVPHQQKGLKQVWGAEGRGWGQSSSIHSSPMPTLRLHCAQATGDTPNPGILAVLTALLSLRNFKMSTPRPFPCQQQTTVLNPIVQVRWGPQHSTHPRPLPSLSGEMEVWWASLALHWCGSKC